MAGAEEVVAALDRRDGVVYAGLALNERGYKRLRETGLDEVSFAVAATESFSQRNAGASVEASIAAAEGIVTRAREVKIRPSLTISVAFGCPFEGPVDPDRVVAIAERLAQTEAVEIVLADTIGVATPRQVRGLTERVAALGGAVGGHFHNTRNTGYANAVAALEGGAAVLDASIGGLGGCPFAPRATGNIATEDLVYLLEGDGVDTRADLDELVRISQWLEQLMGRELPGLFYRAG
jgi:isopropylmalate/homocitrate/citramalate synthase